MSSFSADEVELMRERGNAYCAKVWLGLYDGKTIGNDAESIKDFIMQKYEKKRYVAKKYFWYIAFPLTSIFKKWALQTYIQGLILFWYTLTGITSIPVQFAILWVAQLVLQAQYLSSQMVLTWFHWRHRSILQILHPKDLTWLAQHCNCNSTQKNKTIL